VRSRRLAVLVAGVTVLLALAGIASHGRPLAADRGQGPTPIFFDYIATTILLATIVMAAVIGWAIFGQQFGSGRPRGRWHLASTLVSLFVAAFISWAVLHSHIQDRLRQLGQKSQQQQQHSGSPPKGPTVNPNGRNARIRWDEIAVVLVLLGGTAIVLYARRRTMRPPRRWLGRAEEVSLALDDSLDDLRNDPDLRRAIVAAYARMERTLAAAGLERRPSEAPFEYVARALTSLDTSAESAERLTELFEWAKFSQHEPRPEMREDAIEALVAVRDELRRPAAAPVTA
jgi:uncharacterized protein DUF4129